MSRDKENYSVIDICSDGKLSESECAYDVLLTEDPCNSLAFPNPLHVHVVNERDFACDLIICRGPLGILSISDHHQVFKTLTCVSKKLKHAKSDTS